MSKKAKLTKFQVGLLHNPTHVVEAVDQDEAIAKYNALCGILLTDHTHSVVDVAAAAEAEKQYDATKRAVDTPVVETPAAVSDADNPAPAAT